MLNKIDMNISIEKATVNDAPFVAWTVFTALDMSVDDDMSQITRCCADNNTIYSWRRALLAKVDGKTVGCLIAYDGADYLTQRQYTWSMIWDDFDADLVKNIAIETVPGEYYLDSMAILPEYRGHNIGKSLMFEAIKKGRLAGFTRFGLIVDINKPHLYQYYRTLGFENTGHIQFFSHRYNTLRLTL